MQNLIISHEIEKKLSQKHGVTRREVEQCFDNKCGLLLVDTREDHRSDPPTVWFVAPTNSGRLLKIIFVHREGQNFLRSAYDADEKIQRIYKKHAQ